MTDDSKGPEDVIVTDDRQHCEAVAREWLANWTNVPVAIAGLIQRERAGLLARAEAAEARVGNEHAARVNCVAAVQEECDDLRAKLVAVEAERDRERTIRQGVEVCERGLKAQLAAAGAQHGRLTDLLLGIGKAVGLAPDADCPMDTWASWIIAHSKHKIEKAEATAGKQVAQACAAARDAALEEAAVAIHWESARKVIRALKVTPMASTASQAAPGPKKRTSLRRQP